MGMEGQIREGQKPGSHAEVPPASLIFRYGKKFRHRISGIVARSSRVGNPAVFDPALFDWIGKLEESWPAIREELRALLALRDGIPPVADISPDHRRIAPPGKWRSFFLYGYGLKVEDNCRRCPLTARAVEAVPGLNSAFFSILEPGAHIPRHKGVTKAIITAHLGLIVPKQRASCRMQVGDEVVEWTQGRTLVFDDTYPHEVWNESEESRAILLIQFRRPVGLLGRIVGGLFLAGVRRSRFIQDGKTNLAEWELIMKKVEAEANSES
jgi:beta-hydroxylase